MIQLGKCRQSPKPKQYANIRKSLNMLGQVQEARKTYRNMQEGTDNVERVWKCLQMYGNVLMHLTFFQRCIRQPEATQIYV